MINIETTMVLIFKFITGIIKIKLELKTTIISKIRQIIKK